MAWDDRFQGVIQQGMFTQAAWNRAEDMADEVVLTRAKAERAKIEAGLASEREAAARKEAGKSARALDLAQMTLTRREETIESLKESRATNEKIIKNLEALLKLSHTDNEAMSRSYNELGRQMDNTGAALQSVLRKFPEVGEWMGVNGLRFELSCAETRDKIYSANLSEVKNGAPRHEGRDEPDYLDKIYERMAGASK